MVHKHSPNGFWSRKHNSYVKAQRELQFVFDKAFRDPLLAETVSRVESVLLDVEQGEVLRTPVYTRTFDIFSKR